VLPPADAGTHWIRRIDSADPDSADISVASKGLVNISGESVVAFAQQTIDPAA